VSDKLKELLDEAEARKGGVYLKAVAVCGGCEAQHELLVPEHSYTGALVGLGTFFGSELSDGWGRFRRKEGLTTILLCPECQKKLGVKSE